MLLLPLFQLSSPPPSYQQPQPQQLPLLPSLLLLPMKMMGPSGGGGGADVDVDNSGVAPLASFTDRNDDTFRRHTQE